MTTHLLTPILADGVRHTHFFHGRLLTAEDLRAEQEAHHRHHRQLGRAVGEGVVEGLWVSVENDGTAEGAPSLRITRGLAIERRGATLELPRDVQLLLTREVETPEDAGVFHDCSQLDTSLLGVGDGLYVLVLGPASGYSERAPKSGLGGSSVAGCGSRYEVEGVQFRLVRVDASSLSGVRESTRELLETELLGATTANLSRLSRLRNVSAHLAFGTEAMDAHLADSFARDADGSPLRRRGLVDDLRRLELLSDCEVPLALFAWALEGIQFLDLWSVRRRPVLQSPDAAWPAVAGTRAALEAEARLLQFQEHLDWLVGIHPAPPLLNADEHFLYLPPAGLLPVAGVEAGVEPDAFFGARPRRDPFEGIDGRLLAPILDAAAAHAPIDLGEPEMVWVYRPWQPDLAPEGGAGRSYLVFTTGRMPPFATARFDVARWDANNFWQE